MQSEKQIEAAARADAEYAGRTFDALSSADKTRFRDRAKLMLEAALSTDAEPVCCGKPVHEGSPEGYTLECCGNFVRPAEAEPVKTAPAVAVKALVTEEMVAKAVEAMSSRDITFKYCDKNWQKYAIRHAIEAALSAQVQDVAGWRSMDSAPKDGSEFVAGRRYAPGGEFVVHTYKWVGEPNYWSSKRSGVCIRPQYQDDFVWCPLPASPASKHGDAE